MSVMEIGLAQTYLFSTIVRQKVSKIAQKTTLDHIPNPSRNLDLNLSLIPLEDCTESNSHHLFCSNLADRITTYISKFSMIFMHSQDR